MLDYISNFSEHFLHRKRSQFFFIIVKRKLKTNRLQKPFKTQTSLNPISANTFFAKAWNKTREKYIPEEKRRNLAETDEGSYYNEEEWLEEFLDDNGGFYNGAEAATGGVL